MTKVTDFPIGARVVIKGYDATLEPGDTHYDGLFGTVAGYYVGLGDHGGPEDYVRVNVDKEPNPAEAALLAAFMGAGTLLLPDELELLDE